MRMRKWNLNAVEYPVKAHVVKWLNAGVDALGIPAVWAIVDEDKEPERYIVRSYCAGMDIKKCKMDYLGHAVEDEHTGIVWHYFVEHVEG